MDSKFFAYLAFWAGAMSLYVWVDRRWARRLLSLEPAALQFCMSRAGKILQALAGVGALALTLGLAMFLFGVPYVGDKALVAQMMFVLAGLGHLQWSVRLYWKIEDRISALKSPNPSDEKALDH